MKKLFEKIKQNFEFFEKKQGRPSKETLKKRKIFYVTAILIFGVIIFGTLNFVLNKVNKNKLKGEVLTTTNNFTFAESSYENDTNTYNYQVTMPDNVKYYKLCFYLKDESGNYEQLVCNKENASIDYLSPFTKEDTKEQYKISIQVFDDNNYTVVNKNVNTWKPNGWKTNANDNSAYAEFTIDPSTHATCINDEVENGKVNNTFASSQLSIFKKLINLIYKILGMEPPYKVTVETEQLGIIKKVPEINETSNVSNVTAEKTYNTTFELKNTYNSNAYYKIVKYKSIGMEPENLTDKGTCLPFHGKSVDVKASFNISKTNKEAAGVLKVFLSKELCEAEDGNYTKSFAKSITKYKYIGSTTAKTTTSSKVVPKMVLSKIELYEKNLGLSTVNKKIGDETYSVHEIKNEGQVNVTYNITKNVANESKYYRKMYIYDDFKEGKQINTYSSYCRPYNNFNGVASDDFKIGLSQTTVRTEFNVYSNSNCTGEPVSTTTDYYLYNGGEVKDNNTDGSVSLTAYGHQETACISDMNKLKNAIYKDSTYGDVRIIAANKLKNDYGCGTIVELKGKIQLENQTVSSVRAIVLDIGGTTALKNGTVFDLMLNCGETGTGSLKCSGKEMYYSNPTVTYKVLRKGYKGTPSGVSTTKSNNSKISISFKDTDGSEKDSSGAYVVTSSGSYTPIVTIKNPNAQKIYYRWFTYKGLDASTFNWASSCENTSEKEHTKKDLENLWVDTSGEYSKRSGKLKVYSNNDSCNNDGAGTNNSNVLATSIVNYKYNDPSTNTTGFKFLKNYTSGNANLTNITKKIGSQTPSDCYDYALAYGVYIIKNGNGNFNNLICNNYYHPAGDYGGSAYGAYESGQYDNNVTGYKNMYNKIKSIIDSNLPVVIRVDNSRAGGSGTHFITIIGYKDVTINSWNDFKKSVWVLDPAYLEGGQVMSKPLSSYKYDFYDNKYEPSRLFWWNKAGDAKMPTWCN